MAGKHDNEALIRSQEACDVSNHGQNPRRKLLFQHRIYSLLEPAEDGDRPSRIFDICLVSLIALNVLAVILETIPSVQEQFGTALRLFEIFSVSVFVVEYVLRVWSCSSDQKYRGIISGRIRFAVRPMLVIDLLAILPALLPMLGVDGRALRALRLFRIFRILKLSRYSSAMQLLGAVFRKKAPDLAIVASALLVLLVMAASLMYFAENEAQPEVFPSIPATMWWGIATLTTVGYGDVVPVTGIGQVVGSLVAVLGIGLFALPAGLLAAGFAEELEKRRGDARCPHCGKSLGHDRQSDDAAVR